MPRLILYRRPPASAAPRPPHRGCRHPCRPASWPVPAGPPRVPQSMRAQLTLLRAVNRPHSQNSPAGQPASVAAWAIESHPPSSPQANANQSAWAILNLQDFSNRCASAHREPDAGQPRGSAPPPRPCARRSVRPVAGPPASCPRRGQQRRPPAGPFEAVPVPAPQALPK